MADDFIFPAMTYDINFNIVSVWETSWDGLSSNDPKIPIQRFKK